MVGNGQVSKSIDNNRYGDIFIWRVKQDRPKHILGLGQNEKKGSPKVINVVKIN